MLFAYGSWAVIVPGREARRAREFLRRTGERAGVVEDPGPVSGDQIATLKFVVVTCVAVAVFALVMWLQAQ